MYNSRKLLRETCCRLVTCLASRCHWSILSLMYLVKDTRMPAI